MEEDLGSLWSHQESVDELRNELLYATIRLENTKMEANEEIRKNKETVKHLLLLLKSAYQERDEAKDQLHQLLGRVIPSSPPQFLPHFEPETPMLKPHKANSSMTESNSSFSDTHKGSSPVDSLLDPASSPEFSNINACDSSSMMFVNQPLVQDYSACFTTDRASQVIDSLTKGKVLPQKGKLLQAVMEAGPLLQTLFVAGPLPQWRNPPPPQPLKVPPVSIKEATANLRPPPHSSSSTYVEMSCGPSQMLANSVFDFTGGASGSCLSSMPLLGSGANFSYQIPSSKRLRLQ